MNPHRTQPIEIQPGRRSRRQAERRKKLRQHLLATMAITFLAAVLVLVFGQSEPPTVTATLPDEPEEEVVNDEGFELDRERVLAPVAAERLSGRAERPSERLSRPGEGGSTGAPPPAIPTISSAPPVDEPPRTPAAPNDAPAPADDIDDDPPPPPVTTAPNEPPEEELTRPGTEPPIDAVCWDGYEYDEGRRECVREDDVPEPADRNEDGEEGQEQPEEESSRSDDLGGVSKGPGSVIRKGNE